MKILHLAYRDSSGVPSRWAAAHRAAGHEACLLVELRHPFRYEGASSVMRWTPGTGSAKERAGRISTYLGWADAVMAYDHPFYLDAAVASGKPVLFRALGQSGRDEARRLRKLLKSGSVVRASAGLAELALLLDIELAGAPYPLLDLAEPAEPAVVCHAPSDRAMKQTGAVLRAAKATGWRVDLVERMPNREALERKRRSAVVVDAGPGGVPDGYGVNSIEAMAMGLPAVCGASSRVRERIERSGSPVVLVEDQAGLVAALERLRDVRERRRLGRLGREFVGEFHSGERRAAEDSAVLERQVVVA